MSNNIEFNLICWIFQDVDIDIAENHTVFRGEYSEVYRYVKAVKIDYDDL